MAPARPPVGVSTGVFSRFPEYATPEAVADGMRRLDADCFEVLLFGNWDDPLAAARTLAATGRPVAVVHGAKHIGGLLGSEDPAVRTQGQNLALRAVEVAQILSAPRVNIHLWDLPDSDRHLARNLEALSELLPRVWESGCQLLCETVPCQADVPWRGVQRALDMAEALPGGPAGGIALGVNLDLEFLAWHDGVRETMTRFVPLWGKRLGNVHVKDFDGHPFDENGRRRYVNPGDGTLDYPWILGRLRDAGYSGPLTFEGNVARIADRAQALAETARYLGRMREWAEAAWPDPAPDHT